MLLVLKDHDLTILDHEKAALAVVKGPVAVEPEVGNEHDPVLERDILTTGAGHGTTQKKKIKPKW